MTDDRQSEGPGDDRLRDAELSRRTGARVLLVFEYGGTSYLESEQGWIQKRVVDCARTAGLETLDTREAFREVARRDMDEFRGLFVMRENNQVYGHMSARGNRLIAELIRGKLLQDSAKTASAPEGP